MSTSLWVLIIAPILLMLKKLTKLAPGAARVVVIFGARCIPDRIERACRRAEWEAGILEVPGSLTKLADAISLVAVYLPRSWARYGFPVGHGHQLRKAAFAVLDYQMARVLTTEERNCHWNTQVSFSADSKGVSIGSRAFYALWEWHIEFENAGIARCFYEMAKEAHRMQASRLILEMAEPDYDPCYMSPQFYEMLRQTKRFGCVRIQLFINAN